MEATKFNRNIKPFDGEKYGVWKHRVREFLSEINVISVIDKETPDEPEESWLYKNRLARSAIVTYLSDSLLGLVKPDMTAIEIFKSLDAIYE